MANETYVVGNAQAPQHSQTGTVTASFTQEKALRISNAEYPGMDQCRNGNLYYLGVNGGASVTGKAPLQTAPQNVAAWVITNTSTTSVAWIVEIGVLLESGTAGATGNTVYGAHCTAPAGTASDANLAIVNANGGTTANSSLVFASNVTITNPATSPIWFPLASTKDAANAAVASLCIVNRDLFGRIAIQPGRSFGIAIGGAAGSTPLFVPVVCWFETTATMG
jgi:hypothetical protein